MSSVLKRRKASKKVEGVFRSEEKPNFGFYTENGEELAYNQLNGLKNDIVNERVSRRRAFDRLASLFDNLREIQKGRPIEDAQITSICNYLSEPFLKAGWLPVTNDEIRTHQDKWEKEGKAISMAEVAPATLNKIVRETQNIEKAIQDIAEIDGVVVSVLNSDPYVNPELHTGSDIIVFKWHGIDEKLPLIGCSIIGDGYASMLNDIIQTGREEDIEKDYLGKRDGIDYKDLIVKLGVLNAAIANYNHTAYILQDSNRLNIDFSNNDEKIKLSTLWDGQKVDHSSNAPTWEPEHTHKDVEFDSKGVAPQVEEQEEMEEGVDNTFKM